MLGILTANMESNHTSTSVAISIACLALVAVLSVPAFGHCVTRLRSKTKQYNSLLPDRYEDEDGAATDESQEAYSDLFPRLLLILISVVASAVALATAILTTTRSHLPLSLEQWLQFSTWVRLAALCFPRWSPPP